MTIDDLIKKAGGFKSNADLNSIRVNNEILNNIIDKEFLRISNILPQNRSKSEISYFKSRQQLPKGTTYSTDKEITDKLLKFNVINSDIIYVPFFVPKIEIIGAVKNPGMYPINKNYDMKSYIIDTGGETNLSSKKYYVIHSNGEKNNVSLSFNDFQYGDIIYVESKQDINNWTKFKEIMSVVGQIAALLAVIQSAHN